MVENGYIIDNNCKYNWHILGSDIYGYFEIFQKVNFM